MHGYPTLGRVFVVDRSDHIVCRPIARQLHVRRQSCEKGADQVFDGPIAAMALKVLARGSRCRFEFRPVDRAHSSPILTSSLFTRAPDTIWFAVVAASRRSSTRSVQHCLSAGSSGIRFVTLPSRRLISEY